jgi:hypothetical protein
MAVVFAAWFGTLRSAPIFSVLLFLAHCIGFFLGSIFYYSWGRPVGLMIWGAFYGACLGAGIGGVINLAQSKGNPVESPTPSEDAPARRASAHSSPGQTMDANRGIEISDE